MKSWRYAFESLTPDELLAIEQYRAAKIGPGFCDPEGWCALDLGSSTCIFCRAACGERHKPGCEYSGPFEPERELPHGT